MTKAITVEELIGPPFYFQVDGQFIRWDKFKEIVAKQPLIVDNVTAIKRGKSNKVLNLKLPISGDPNIALLVAKVMGDGHLTHNFRFTYYNSENTLIDEVISAVEGSIGKVDYYRWNERDSSNCFRVRFPSVVGYLLYLFGAPTGEKVKKEFGVPAWIKNGSHEIKTAFLRGLFDDECSVVHEVKRCKRTIVIAMGKRKESELSLVVFLKQIRNMLIEFGVLSKEIFFQAQKNGVVMLRFSIYGRKNLEAFNTTIGFSHPKKRGTLNLMCSTYVDLHRNRNTILATLIHSNVPLTTPQISKMTGIDRNLVGMHLNLLYNEGKVSKSIGSNPMYWSADTSIILKNKKERVLQSLSDDPTSAAVICKLSGVDYTYTLNRLNRLRIEGKVTYVNKAPKLWRLVKSADEPTVQTGLQPAVDNIS